MSRLRRAIERLVARYDGSTDAERDHIVTVLEDAIVEAHSDGAADSYGRCEGLEKSVIPILEGP